MSTAEKSKCFNMIDENEAYVVHAKKGALISLDNRPILFIAGENAKYKFLLRSAFVFEGNKLNILLKSENEMVTPKFSMAVRCFSKEKPSIYDGEVVICPHGSHVAAGQHFYAEIEVPQYAVAVAKTFSLKVNIGGTSTPFRVWSPDMKSIATSNSDSELILPWKN